MMENYNKDDDDDDSGGGFDNPKFGWIPLSIPSYSAINSPNLCDS